MKVNSAEELGGMRNGSLYRLLNTDVDMDCLGLEIRMRSHSLDLSDRFSRTLNIYIRHDHTASTLFSEGQAAGFANAAC
ncbi:hypothetical protein VMCG_03307 [Cytospora schulzeri]|uniref:Uncharacterized protein n=1 Tax=Cytospora schulzeri TaxID=448051 RepID=A0A423WXI6_9PEZI|nr:hypothetical protein VMCG_03307 [Valsa malicola]